MSLCVCRCFRPMHVTSWGNHGLWPPSASCYRALVRSKTVPALFPGGQEGAVGLGSTTATTCPPQPGLPCPEVSPAANPATALTSQTQNHELENQCSRGSVGLVPAEGPREPAAGAHTHPQESHVSRHPLAPPTTELPHAVTWASAGMDPSPLHNSSSSHCLCLDTPSGQTPPGQFPRPQAAFPALSSVNTGKHVENISTKWSQKQCPSRPSARLPRPEAVEPSVSRNCRSLTVAGGWK